MDSPVHRNILINQKCTPLRHLGLSRKRKPLSSDKKSESSLSNVYGLDSPRVGIGTCDQAKIKKQRRETGVGIKKKLYESDRNSIGERSLSKPEITLEELKNRILEKEKKLQSLHDSESLEVEMERIQGLQTMWKNGCKNGLLYLFEILKQKENNVNLKQFLKQIGIYQTILDHFENDEDFDFSSYDSENDEN